MAYSIRDIDVFNSWLGVMNDATRRVLNTYEQISLITEDEIDLAFENAKCDTWQQSVAIK